MKIKRIFAMAVVMLFLLSLGAGNVFAAIKPATAGDANLDYTVNINDATLIQKFIADLCEMNGLQKGVSEVDGDGKVTVRDATMIQKRCAGLIDFFVVYDNVWRDFNAESLVANYDSGKAMVGVPVTFTATADGYGEPFYYQFFVNDKAVTEMTEENTFTFTFDETGFYDIEVKMKSSYGMSDINGLSWYEVVEPYKSDTLMIKHFYHDKSPGLLYATIGNTTFYAQAMFGSGSYEYAFYWDGELLKDYSTDNTYTMDDDTFRDKGEHTMTVYIRDTETADVASQDMVLEVVAPII